MKGLERDVERAFVRGCQLLGVLALKFKPPGSDGWPDRVLLAPGKKFAFFELKREGETPTKLQYTRIRTLDEWGFEVGWADNIEEALAFVRDTFA